MIHHSTNLLQSGHQVAGYVLKENNSSELENALMNVRKGYKYFTPSIMTRMVEGFKLGKTEDEVSEDHTCLSTLTSREREVLSLVANGMTGKEICGTPNISESTLKSHKTRLLKKLNVKSTNELIVLINKDHQFSHLIT